MPEKAWKRSERRLAELLGGERVGLTPGEHMDVRTPWLSVEVKERKRIAGYLKDWMAQAVRNARRKTLPIVVLHELGQRHGNDLVIMRLADFSDWFANEMGEIVNE